MSDFQKQRRYMVEHHIAARGVRSALVLKAMGAVPREEFVPAYLRDAAYEVLLKSRRRELHAAIASVIQTKFPSRATMHPELVAQRIAYRIKPAVSGVGAHHPFCGSAVGSAAGGLED